MGAGILVDKFKKINSEKLCTKKYWLKVKLFLRLKQNYYFVGIIVFCNITFLCMLNLKWSQWYFGLFIVSFIFILFV